MHTGDEMGDYEQLQEQTRKKSVVAGVVAAVVFHACILAVLFFTGLKYIYPPPAETGIEISFEEERQQETIETVSGTAPRSPAVRPQEDVRLARASQAPYEGEKPNEAEEAVNDDFGDVETPDPRPETEKKEIDKRALFPSADNKAAKDTLAAQTSAFIAEALAPGHPQGNTENARNEDSPNVNLPGRKLMGELPEPEDDMMKEGKVVVSIWVDSNGKVTRAVAGAPGTTLNDHRIWKAAEEAAMKARFDASTDISQEGTITYIYTLK